jgi:hypothetical protein
MAYVDPNFRSKKELKAAVAAGDRLRPYSPGPWPVLANGTVLVKGPHYPQPHRWYASVQVENGVIVKVIS